MQPTIKSTVITVLCLLCLIPAFNQAITHSVFQEWAKPVGISDQVYKSGSAFDNAGNLYTIGGSISGNGDFDWQITKYRPSGLQVWSVMIDTSGFNDYLTDIVIDANCNLYLTGAFTIDTAQGMDVGIVMMDSSGIVQWVYTYDNGQSYPNYDDAGASIAYDGVDYLYIAGMVTDATTLQDYLTLQIKASDGTFQWLQTFDNNNLMDAAGHVYFDGTNAIVTGKIQKSPPYHAIYSIEYDNSGSVVTSTGTSSALDSITQVKDICIGNDGDIYAVGYLYNPSTGRNAKIMKMDSTLNVVWQFNSTFPLDDEANSIRVDDQNRVYVGGYRTQIGSNKDFLFARLNSSGSTLWGPNYFDGAYGGNDIIYATTIDASGNPIFTGYSQTDSLNGDYYTIKYDTAGSMIYEINYNGLANKNDRASDIALDNSGNIFVIGQSQDSSGVSSSYITVKYVEHDLYVIPDTVEIPQNFDVTPNFGQVLNTDTIIDVNTDVKFYTSSPTAFFENTKLIHVFNKVDTAGAHVDTLVRVDMTFTTDTSRRVFAQNKRSYYSNYYFPQTAATKGLCGVPSYEKIVYPDLYKAIDLEVSATGYGLRELFIVKPSGDGYDIGFLYDGADTVYIDNGNLVIATLLDTLIYYRPVCSQIDSSGNAVSIAWQPIFKFSGDTVTFDSIQSYNINLPLIIDMNQGIPNALLGGGGDNLDWSTYYGGGAYDIAQDIADDKSNIFICGGTFTLSLPTQLGTTSYNGLDGVAGGEPDAFYIKFNSLAHLEHRTYYGGLGYDKAYGIAYGRDIIMVGETTSSDLVNNTDDGMNHTTLYGSTDGFIFAVSPTGMTAKCDSYIGTATIDICTAVSGASGGGGTMYAVVGRSNGASFPTTSTGSEYIQTSGALSYNNGFIMKLDVLFDVEWASLYGGDETDVIVDVNIDDNGTITVYGITDETTLHSTNNTYPSCLPPTDGSFPICIRSGAYNQPTAGGGGQDMFIAEFSPANELVWGTLFGTDGEETRTFDGNPHSPGGLEIDNVGDAYITGAVKNSASGITFATINGTTYSQTNYIAPQIPFIAKFENRDIAWYTLFGGNSLAGPPGENSFGADITVDDQGFIFVAGATEIGDIQSSPDYCTVPNAIDEEFPICNESGISYLETDNNLGAGYSCRTFIAGFDPLGHLIWSTRYGNGSSNWATGITNTSLDNKVYITGVGSVNTVFDYTFRELIPCPNANCNEDYKQPLRSGGRDAVVARFSGSLLIGLDEYKSSNELLVYPNPTNNFCNIVGKGNNTDMSNASVFVYDLTGKIVSCPIIKGQNTIQLDLQSLTPGLYIIRVSDVGSSSIYKVIKS